MERTEAISIGSLGINSPVSFFIRDCHVVLKTFRTPRNDTGFTEHLRKFIWQISVLLEQNYLFWLELDSLFNNLGSAVIKAIKYQMIGRNIMYRR